MELLPDEKLWFLDGKDETGKTVSNPNIGYGSQMMEYADGSTKEFYQIGISPISTGISIYVMGLDDKNFQKTASAKSSEKPRLLATALNSNR